MVFGMVILELVCGVEAAMPLCIEIRKTETSCAHDPKDESQVQGTQDFIKCTLRPASERVNVTRPTPDARISYRQLNGSIPIGSMAAFQP